MSSNNSSAFACPREEMICLGSMNNNYVHYIVNVVLGFLLALASMLGNGLVFAAYYYSPSLHRPVNMILLSLAATDFLTGAITQPLFIWEKILMALGNCTRTVCIVTEIEKYFLLFLIGETVLNLSVTTLDRYIAVFYPYKYPELVTGGRIKKVLGIIWVVWATISIATHLSSNVGISLSAVLFVNITVIAVSYFKLFREIRRMEANAVVPSGQVNQEEERKAGDRKSTSTVGYILGSLFLSFIPFIIFAIINNRNLLKNSKEGKELILLYGSTASLSNSATNVFIYYWRNEEMRRAMKKAVRKITGQSNQINTQ